jgi:hypothetical protein
MHMVITLPQAFLSPMTLTCHYAESTDWTMRIDVFEVPFQAPDFFYRLAVVLYKDLLFASLSSDHQQQNITTSYRNQAVDLAIHQRSWLYLAGCFLPWKMDNQLYKSSEERPRELECAPHMPVGSLLEKRRLQCYAYEHLHHLDFLVS